MKIKISKLHKDAVLPTKAHKFDAGWDLYACEIVHDKPNIGQTVIHTGIAVEVPVGYVGLIFPRSSVVKTGYRLGNGVGVIDPGYVGEIKLVFDLFRVATQPVYEVGDRCGQIMLIKNTEFDWEVVDGFNNTTRGTGGFGSTGK